MNSDQHPYSDINGYWDRWAPVWDFFLRTVGLDRRYREQGVSVVDLKMGDRVLDVACGTGLNFPYLFDAVGPGGRIIAVDISPGMLARAEERARKNEWHNIEFILGDICNLPLPEVQAATSFWCMVSIPDYRSALANIAASLVSGGRVAVLDFKPIDGLPGYLLNPIFALICRLTHQDIHRKPWKDLTQLFVGVQTREWAFGGFGLANVYLSWGVKR